MTKLKIMKKPNVMILRADGTNCDEELFYAFELSGGNPKYVHVNELRNNKTMLKDFQILALPGGFSYGDDIMSGKIMAVELSSFFADELQKFVERKNTATVGICNGFQILVRTGLLPFGKLGKMDATLTNNDSGHFECRWVNMKVEKGSASKFTNGMEGKTVSYQVAHGEGKFFASDEVIKTIGKQNLVVFRYVDENGFPTQTYPDNPNGALNAIAGITDPSGRILGLMPHPERFVKIEQHPNWRRMRIEEPQGLPLFQNMVEYVKES